VEAKKKSKKKKYKWKRKKLNALKPSGYSHKKILAVGP
jgi:hypothetical protein